MIEVQNLVKMYGKHLAVDHLSFQIEKGKIYGFLGPNGAGKSTTMNIMTGYIGATEGKVLIDGHDILKEPEEAKKCIGYLPEQPPVYMDMTVLEYLQFAAELKSIPKKDRANQISRAISLTKLAGVRERLIQNLSKGYKQRVGLAQAILGFPEIIILDEPTVGLDPKQIIEIRELIRRLAKDHTVILSSHILAEIREVCDYILIIANGKLVASDTPEHLEAQMKENGSIVIEAKAERAALEAVIKTVPAVLSADYKAEDDGVMSIAIESRKDIREELFRAFANQGIPLLTLMLKKTTLEQIFLELTQGTAGGSLQQISDAKKADSKPSDAKPAKDDKKAENEKPAKDEKKAGTEAKPVAKDAGDKQKRADTKESEEN